jgi:hypothetical protein
VGMLEDYSVRSMDHAVWEYDAGPRGQPDWRRYPDDIEASLENLFNCGAPKLAYKPGDKEAEGMYASIRTRHPVRTRGHAAASRSMDC